MYVLGTQKNHLFECPQHMIGWEIRKLSWPYYYFIYFLSSSERIQRRYGELNGELLLVELRRGSTGLGISLAGNKDRNTMSVFVAGIQPDSAAGQDGQIQIGDELLEVK